MAAKCACRVISKRVARVNPKKGQSKFFEAKFLQCQNENGTFKTRRFAKKSEQNRKGVFCPAGGAPKRIGIERKVTPAMRRKAAVKRARAVVARTLGPLYVPHMNPKRIVKRGMKWGNWR